MIEVSGETKRDTVELRGPKFWVRVSKGGSMAHDRASPSKFWAFVVPLLIVWAVLSLSPPHWMIYFYWSLPPATLAALLLLRPDPQMHGAEHMVINCYESLGSVPDSIEAIRSSSVIARRCGTMFITSWILASAVFYGLFKTADVFQVDLTRAFLVAVPVLGLLVAWSLRTISYRGWASDFVHLLSAKIQALQTSTPDEEHLTLVLDALKKLVDLESSSREAPPVTVEAP